MASSLSSSSTLSLMKEIKKLIKNPLDDISVFVKNDNNLSIISAYIDGPESTPFANGKFEIELHFNLNNYPSQPPKGYFLTKIFHPNVAPRTGEICVNTLKKDWKPSYGIKHILIAIRSLLIIPNYDSALNEEAGKLLLTSYDSYVERAKLFTKIHSIPIEKKKKQKEENQVLDKENLNNQKKKNNENKTNINTKENDNDLNGKYNKNEMDENNLKNDDEITNENNENNKNNKNNKNKSKSKSKSKSKKKSKVSKSMRRL